MVFKPSVEKLSQDKTPNSLTREELSSAIQDPWLAQDQADLLAVLELRFGDIPEGVIQQVRTLDDGNALQRLILVAANAPTWEAFYTELLAGPEAFRLVGERFDPLRQGNVGDHSNV